MSLTAAEREALRARISEARRAATSANVNECPNGYGTTGGYRLGCRCDACRIATTDARRDRRVRALAGLTRPYRQWDRDSVIAAIQAFAEEHGFQPTSSETGPAHGLPSYGVVCRIFGSWNAGISAAGFTPYPAYSYARTWVARERKSVYWRKRLGIYIEDAA